MSQWQKKAALTVPYLTRCFVLLLQRCGFTWCPNCGGRKYWTDATGWWSVSCWCCVK